MRSQRRPAAVKASRVARSNSSTASMRERTVAASPRECPAAIEGGCEALGRGKSVDGHRQVHALGCDASQALPLVGAERRVVHEDARRAGLLEDLGLAG